MRFVRSLFGFYLSVPLLFITLFAAACASSTTPTPVPPTEDPPQISCPAPQTIQLTSGTSASVTFTPTTTKGKAPVAVTCAPLSGSPFNVGTTTVNCSATDALQRTAPCTFTVTVLAVVPPPVLSATTFVAFGDSITRGEDGIDGPPTPACSSVATARLQFGPRVILPDAQTYPGQLQQMLIARYKVQTPSVDNQGCPGEALNDQATTTEVDPLTRFDRLIASRRYESVLIMEGSNDMLLATKDSHKLGSALVVLRQMVGDAKSRGLKPLLATIPPMNPAGVRAGGAAVVPDFNIGVKGIAQAESVPLVDVNAAFNNNFSLIGADGLHPTAAGYTVIASAFADAIKNNLELKTSVVTTLRRR